MGLRVGRGGGGGECVSRGAGVFCFNEFGSARVGRTDCGSVLLMRRLLWDSTGNRTLRCDGGVGTHLSAQLRQIVHNIDRSFRCFIV